MKVLAEQDLQNHTRGKRSLKNKISVGEISDVFGHFVGLALKGLVLKEGKLMLLMALSFCDSAAAKLLS